MKDMRLIFKIRTFVYQSKANLDEKILCNKISHHRPRNLQKAGNGQAWK